MRSALGIILIVFSLSTLGMPAEPKTYPGLPKVDTLTPRGWHRGATVEVEFTGARLNNPKGVLTPGTDRIKVVKIEAVQPEKPDKARPEDFGKTVKATLEIAPDCPAGPQWLRLWTDYGVGEVTAFWIGSLPTVTEAENADKKDVNGSLETAEKLPGPATVNGFFAGTDADYFQIEAKAGTVLSAEVECARLAAESDDGTEFLLTFQDASGKALASCDDTPLFLADPFVSVMVRADGPIFVGVKPMLPSSNGRKTPYRLHVGNFLRPAGIFPAGGAPGELLSARLLGIPDEKLAGVEISLPMVETGFFSHTIPGGAAPNELRVSPGTNLVEKEPNGDGATATAAGAVAPLALNGILEKDGDTDCFRFHARKDERLIISAFAQAVGSPADLQLSLLPATAKSGQNPDRADDSTEGDLDFFEQSYTREKLDPRMIFTAKEAGDFILTVKDSRNLGGPLFVYRIEISPATPGLLLGLNAPDNNARLIRTAVAVGRGNRSLVQFNVRPTFGTQTIDGELELRAEGLPTGVTMQAPKFKFDRRRLPVMFEAAADAAVSAAMVRFYAMPTGAGNAPLRSTFRHHVGLTYQNNEITSFAAFDRLAFAVTEAIPFRLKATPPPAPLSRNGEMLLEIELERDPGFSEPVEIVAENLPQGLAPQAGVTMRPAEVKTTFRLGAEGGAPLGVHPICLTARSRGLGDGRWGKMHAATAMLDIEVAEPFVRIKIPRCGVERGRKTTVTATIERLRELPGPASLRLIRLPKGLSMANAPSPLPTSGDKMNLEIEASVDALVGTYSSIGCELAIDSGGREIKQIVGSAMVRIDPQRKAQ